MISVETSTFRDPGRDSQRVFRSVMRALAEPARPVPLQYAIAPPDGLSTGAAAVLLTLADFETTFWLDEPAAKVAAIGDYLRFHTGARLVGAASDATFAVITDPVRMPALATFAQGTHEYPDRSTTLIIDAAQLDDRGWTCRGPGIDGTRTFGVARLASTFVAQWEENGAGFPLGVDIVFVAGRSIAGLPRTTRLMEG